MLRVLILASIAAASAWMVMPVPSPQRCQLAHECRRPVCHVQMQEDVAAPTESAAPMEDFTEDLLEALATDAPPLNSPMLETEFSGEEGAELEPREAYVNAVNVEAARAKWKQHENDTGSSQVQIAVLSARIAYLTKHMQQNKKDYASLRGLTAMVTRRRKLLTYLYKEDPASFLQISSELGIRTNQILKPKLQGARGRRV